MSHSVKLPRPHEVISRFNMQPHPEGGFYAETYRADMVLPQSSLGKEFGGDRNASTAILFCLPAGSHSSLHRIAADELWHFHAGDPIEVVSLQQDGSALVQVCGMDIAAGQLPQVLVKAGTWFGARPVAPPTVGYSLVGCTVAPGFDFADFELGSRAELLKQFKQAEEWINRLGAEG